MTTPKTTRLPVRGRKATMSAGGAAAKAGRAAAPPPRKAADPLIAFCRSLPGATEDIKWGKDLIFSVGGKMFAGFMMPDAEPVGFKVDPLVFDSLVGRDGIIPAPYAARFHWVSVTERRRLKLATLKGFLESSHALVAAGLPRKTRLRLGIPEPDDAA